MFYIFAGFACFMGIVCIIPVVILGIIAGRASCWAREAVNKYYGTWLGACIYVMATQQAMKLDIKTFPKYSDACCQLYILFYDQRKEKEDLTK